jgi:hypothetical protein
MIPTKVARATAWAAVDNLCGDRLATGINLNMLQKDVTKSEFRGSELPHLPTIGPAGSRELFRYSDDKFVIVICSPTTTETRVVPGSLGVGMSVPKSRMRL